MSRFSFFSSLLSILLPAAALANPAARFLPAAPWAIPSSHQEFEAAIPESAPPVLEDSALTAETKGALPDVIRWKSDIPLAHESSADYQRTQAEEKLEKAGYVLLGSRTKKKEDQYLVHLHYTAAPGFVPFSPKFYQSEAFDHEGSASYQKSLAVDRLEKAGYLILVDYDGIATDEKYYFWIEYVAPPRKARRRPDSDSGGK